MEFNKEAEWKLREYLGDHDLSVGMGNSESACSVAAINLALSNTLTDKIPLCMSPTLGAWIISIQDSIPASIRNSYEWKDLLPLAAGSGRDHEKERLDVIMGWVWATVLPQLQPLANRGGFGREWETMLSEKTPAASYAASDAARAANVANAAYAASDSAARAARAVSASAASAAGAASAAYAAASAAYAAANAAAAVSASASAAHAANAEYWENCEIIETFRELVKLS